LVRATFVGYRRGKSSWKKGEALIRVEGIRSVEKAAQLIGRKVLIKNGKGRHYVGKVLRPHGRKGVVRVRFRKGPPAWSVGAEVEIQ